MSSVEFASVDDVALDVASSQDGPVRHASVLAPRISTASHASYASMPEADMEKFADAIASKFERRTMANYLKEESKAAANQTDLIKLLTERGVGAQDSAKQEAHRRKTFQGLVVVLTLVVAILIGMTFLSAEVTKEVWVDSTQDSSLLTDTNGAVVQTAEARQSLALYQAPWLSEEILATTIGHTIQYTNRVADSTVYDVVQRVEKVRGQPEVSFVVSSGTLVVKPAEASLVVNGLPMPLCGELSCAKLTVEGDLTDLDAQVKAEVGEFAHRRLLECGSDFGCGCGDSDAVDRLMGYAPSRRLAEVDGDCSACVWCMYNGVLFRELQDVGVEKASETAFKGVETYFDLVRALEDHEQQAWEIFTHWRSFQDAFHAVADQNGWCATAENDAILREVFFDVLPPVSLASASERVIETGPWTDYTMADLRAYYDCPETPTPDILDAMDKAKIAYCTPFLPPSLVRNSLYGLEQGGVSFPELGEVLGNATNGTSASNVSSTNDAVVAELAALREACEEEVDACERDAACLGALVAGADSEGPVSNLRACSARAARAALTESCATEVAACEADVECQSALTGEGYGSGVAYAELKACLVEPERRLQQAEVQEYHASQAALRALSAHASFVVEQGLCKLDYDGCVTSPHYPGRHGNYEHCVIKTTKAGIVSATHFDVEWGYDYLTMKGHKYWGREGPSGVRLQAGEQFEWFSDYSVTYTGFKVCFNFEPNFDPRLDEHDNGNKCVPPTEDQLGATCWAHAATTALEGRWCVKEGSAAGKELSEGFTATCGMTAWAGWVQIYKEGQRVTSTKQNSCQYGSEGSAWHFFTTHGAEMSSSNSGVSGHNGKYCWQQSYMQMDVGWSKYVIGAAHEVSSSGDFLLEKVGEKCNAVPDQNRKKAFCPMQISVNSDDADADKANKIHAIKTLIKSTGPVTTGICACPGMETPGIWPGCDKCMFKKPTHSRRLGALFGSDDPAMSGSGGHLVRIVGFGTEAGVDYWLVANSWGGGNKKWNGDNYFRMSIDGWSKHGISTNGMYGTGVVTFADPRRDGDPEPGDCTQGGTHGQHAFGALLQSGNAFGALLQSGNNLGALLQSGNTFGAMGAAYQSSSSLRGFQR